MEIKQYKIRPCKRQNKDSTSKSAPMIEVTASGENLPTILSETQDFDKRWCTMPAQFASHYDKIYHFKVRDDDVFVVTFPKSGTTWIQEALWLLMNDLNYEETKSKTLKQRSTFLELSSINPQIPFDTVEAANQLKSPRLLKSHLPAQLLPHQLWQHKNKIVYCARNIKDVVVSYYNFVRGVGYWSGDMDNFVQDFICNDIMFTPFWEGVLDFWQLRHESNIFFTTYEQLKADLPAVLSDLCEFLERPALSQQEMEKLVQHLSFDNMKSNISTNPTAAIIRIDNTTGEPLPELQFMRRGIVGAYKDELSIKNQKLLDEWSQKMLEKRQIKISDIWGDLKC